MRKRFEPQMILGQLPISDTPIPLKSRDRLVALVAALKEIITNSEWNEKVFVILENKITANRKKTGRNGMDLWYIFVLAQVRHCLNIGYDRLHYISNYDKLIRQLMGVETEFGYERKEFEYQNIFDNVSLLDDTTVKELNDVIVDFGHSVFKKKESAPLRLKTDSFVVKSNVHFPTDYNLLWDCARKSLDTVYAFLDKYTNILQWRKIEDWYAELKSMMRALGRASVSGGNGKEQRVKSATKKYLRKAGALKTKLQNSKHLFPANDEIDMVLHFELQRYMDLLDKHIDLVNRRLLKGESIPHHEKLFSIFEQYTEWITKGKSHPNVELGKNTAITSDQYNLIVDYHVMDHESDGEIVIPLAERLTKKYQVESWSFDRGFWSKENKLWLKQYFSDVIMPKKGKRNVSESEEENQKKFRHLKHKHSAIESNINEIEHCGLDQCPDRGFRNFKRYVGVAVCAYNLKRIGRKLIEQQLEEINLRQHPGNLAA
jgi:transposase, IS5 family